MISTRILTGVVGKLKRGSGVRKDSVVNDSCVEIRIKRPRASVRIPEQAQTLDLEICKCNLAYARFLTPSTVVFTPYAAKQSWRTKNWSLILCTERSHEMVPLRQPQQLSRHHRCATPQNSADSPMLFRFRRILKIGPSLCLQIRFKNSCSVVQRPLLFHIPSTRIFAPLVYRSDTIVPIRDRLDWTLFFVRKEEECS